jgi:hypothetical protein
LRFYNRGMFEQHFEKIWGFSTLQGRLTSLPPWARFLVFVAALPGIVLLTLSILALVVSLSALLLLSVPVYTVLKRLTTQPVREEQVIVSPGVKRVDATVVE